MKHPVQGPFRSELVAFLGGVAMFLSTIEFLIPKPVPFFRVGLSMVPLLIGSRYLRFSELMALLILKVLTQALVNGTLFSYVFIMSLGGTLASTLVMYALAKLPEASLGFVGISLAGAMASTSFQIVYAVSVVFGTSSWVIAPVLYAIGLPAGLVLGLFTQVFAQRSRWLGNQFRGADHRLSGELHQVTALPSHWTQPSLLLQLAGPRFWLGVAALGFAPLFLVDAIIARIALLVLWYVGARLSGKRIRHVYFIWLATIIIIFSLAEPSGLVLLQVGPLTVTEGALLRGIGRASGLISSVFFSLFAVQRGLHLPGRGGKLFTGALDAFYGLYGLKSLLGKEKTRGLGPVLDRLDRGLWVAWGQFSLGSRPEDNGGAPIKPGLGPWILGTGMVAASWLIVFLTR